MKGRGGWQQPAPNTHTHTKYTVYPGACQVSTSQRNAPKDPGLALCSAFWEMLSQRRLGKLVLDWSSGVHGTKTQWASSGLQESSRKDRHQGMEKENLHGFPNCLFFTQLGPPDISLDCLGTRSLKDSRPEGTNSSAKSCKKTLTSTHL